jgi:hypothetical protein
MLERTEYGGDKRDNKEIRGDSSKDKGRNPLGTNRAYSHA